MHELLRKHFFHPKNINEFDNSDPHIGTSLIKEQNDACALQLQIHITNHIIKDACFKALGPPELIALGSFITGKIKDMTIDAARNIDSADIIHRFNLPSHKIYCAIIVEDALKSAIEDYQNKHK